MMNRASHRPFLMDRFRRSRWLGAVILPFFLSMTVDAGHITEVLSKSKARRDYKKEVARKQGMDERFLLDPDAYLKQTLKKSAPRTETNEPAGLSKQGKVPDHTDLKRRYKEEVRISRLKHLEEVREQVKRMAGMSQKGAVPEMEWKTLDLKLRNVTLANKTIQKEMNEELGSLSKRGVGFWKRFRYGSQRRNVVRTFTKLAERRDEIVKNHDLKQLTKALELDGKPETTRQEFKSQYRALPTELSTPAKGKPMAKGIRRHAEGPLAPHIEWVRLADAGGGILSPPTPAPTYGDTIDPSVASFAQEYGYDPVRIFEAIYNKFDFEPYYGSAKGAKGTLLDLKANDWDLALLLRDALRVSGYEAELEHGLVENEFSELAQFLGVSNPDKVSYILATAGIPGNVIQDGLRKYARFEHVWVAAKVPYEDYRGRTGSAGDRQWIDLDPSFKPHKVTPGINVSGGLSFNFEDYVSRLDARSPKEYFEDSLWAYMKRAGIICNTLDEIPEHAEILPFSGPYLPNGLRSTQVASIGTYKTLPDAYRKKVVLSLEDQNGNSFLSQTLPLQTALYGSVALTYAPASGSDAQIIASYGSLENTPPYLIRLQPELRIDGQVVQMGDEVGAGQRLTVRLDISGQRLNLETEKFPAISGAEMALILAQGGVSSGALTQHISVLSNLQNNGSMPDRAIIAQQRYLLGAKYYHEFGLAAEKLAGYFNYKYVGGVHAGFCATKYVLGGLYGLTNSWSKQGTVFSAERSYLGIVPMGTGTTASVAFNRLFGANGSFLEHQSGEAVNAKDFVSTVKIFQLASVANVGRDTLTAANIESKLPAFPFLDADAIADMRNAVGLGKVVILPTSQITRNQWTGTGYMRLNTTTGTSDYIISGRYAGGDETGGESGGDEKSGCSCSEVASRIYHSNGQYVTDYSELMVPSKGIPAVFAFGYNNQRQYASEMGYGWEHTFGRRLYIEEGGAKVTFYNEEHLAQVFHDSAGSFRHPPGFFATLTQDGALYKMRRKDNTTWTFAPSGQLLSILNLDSLGLIVDTTAQGTASEVRNTEGDTLLTFAYAAGLLTSVSDPASRQVSFQVDAQGDLVTFVNTVGDTTGFTYFNDHNLESKMDGLGHVRSFVYDENDRLMEYTDAKGNITSYIHDDAHRQFVEVDPQGNEFTSTYDAKGFPVLQVDGTGNRTAFQYDSHGNLVSKQDSRGYAYSAQYDGFGNKLFEQLPDSTRKFYAYDSLNLMTKDSNATENLVSHYEFTPQGHLSQQDNADGTHESFLYDGYGQLLRKVGRADDTTLYTYDARGGVQRAVGPIHDTTTYLYDSLGRMSGFVNAVHDTTKMILDAKDRIHSMIDGEGYATSILYDAAGNRSALVNAQGDTSFFILDENNNVVETHLPNGAVLASTYNELNQVISRTDPLGHLTRYQYDKGHAGGRLLGTVDALGQSLQNGYCGEEKDPCNQIDKNGLVTKLERDGQYRVTKTTDAEGNSVSYTYDSRGNKASMTDGEGKVTYYAYDSQNRLIRVIGALNDTTEYVYNDLGQRIYDINANHDTVAYVYDKNSRMTEERDQTGHWTQYAYDAAGRMALKVDANGDSTHYFYTHKGQVKEIHYQDGVAETFEYDALGRKVAESNGLISYGYRYDKVGRLIEFQNHTLAKTLKYEYDLAGNKTAQINAEGERAEYQYDALNRLVRIQDVNGGVTRFEYDRMGNRTKLIYPNGVYTVYGYDSAYRLLEIAHFGRDNGLLAGYNYTYDKVGNRKTMTDARGTHTYHYDDLYRLTGVDYPEGRTQRWAYDGTGQRLREIEAIPSSIPDTIIYHYTRDRLDSTTGKVTQTFSYDANGSMIRKGSESFQYDAKMCLQRAQANGEPLNVFAYDPMGLRVQTVNSEGKITYLIDPASNTGQFNMISVSAEYKNGTKSREFGLGARPDEVLWEENADGLFYLLYDGLGSVVALTNTSGLVIGQAAYDAFGKVFSHTGIQGRYGFTGRPTDTDIGLQYNRSRFYDFVTAIWNKRDGASGNQQLPSSLQKYVYAINNPVTYTDPSGFEASDGKELFLLTRIVEFAAAVLSQIPAFGKELAEIFAGVFAWAFFAVGIAEVIKECQPMDCVILKVLIEIAFFKAAFIIGARLTLKSEFTALSPLLQKSSAIISATAIGLILDLWSKGAEMAVDYFDECKQRCGDKG